MFRSYNDHASAIRSKTTGTAHSSRQLLYYCTICSNSSGDVTGYASETEVEVHKQAGHKLSVDTYGPQGVHDGLCFVCARNFKTRDNLVAHIKVAHLFCTRDAERIQREIFVCNLCEHIFFNKGMFLVHALNRHRTFEQRHPTTPCPHCKKHIRRASLWYHFETNGMKSVSTCPICLVKMPNRKALNRHTKTHPYDLKCHICHYETSKVQFFLNHIKQCKTKEQRLTYYPKSIKKYFIGGCRPHRWYYNVQFIKEGLNLFGMVAVCVYCKQICTTKEAMRMHISEVHFNREKEETKLKECSCGELFTNNILAKHHTFKYPDHILVHNSGL